MATNKIAIRRDTKANWISASAAGAAEAVLVAGEQGYETDTGRRKVGDGTTTYRDLPYEDRKSPAEYARSQRWRIKDNTTNKAVIVSPGELVVRVDDALLVLDAAVEVDLNTAASWDASTYATASNRSGKDFYMYACTPATGQDVAVVLSANATTPTGYTAANSRKIGGFHCLSANAGTLYSYVNSADDVLLVDEVYVSHTITGTKHWLDGYVAGDPLPFSLWDLLHRPASAPEGMVYAAGVDKWVDIYLASWNGTRLVSASGGTIADGTSTPKWHQYKFSQAFGRQKKRLPRQDEFVSFSLGSPQGVNITGSADPGTTGPHTATDGKRILSLIGCEDTVGVMWQWGIEAGATNAVGSAWADAFDTNDANVAGQHYEAPNRPLFGGAWGSGAECGSRGAHWYYPALNLNSSIGARGVAEPGVGDYA